MFSSGLYIHIYIPQKPAQYIGDQLSNQSEDGPFQEETHVFWLPSGYVKIAIENGHRNSDFSH